MIGIMAEDDLNQGGGSFYQAILSLLAAKLRMCVAAYGKQRKCRPYGTKILFVTNFYQNTIPVSPAGRPTGLI